MFNSFRKKIAAWIFSDYIGVAEKAIADGKRRDEELEKKKKDLSEEVNRKVAAFLLQMDPLEPLMKEYNGIFSVEYEHPEDQLDEPSKIGMYMWAYQQKNDIHFKYMADWIMNKSGNSAMKLGNPTDLQIWYKRAEIANMILFRKEVGRLASNYESILYKNKPEEFDVGVSVSE